ncbi:thiosulfate dehydrogenase [quinone] large subunit [Microbacterium halimionae]|uniref:Thiosulfate dehydrogenase [quinone] large subunit n=1 Tax=Microbacterium halimionae TaxID=1526413 RepID=A0A7W3JMD3_9MICO|nr:DoxX family protein [Microbacterium halimionae]MBA8815476.1 thiosulfate dehydrogenase [quinone] large subunit [Microbacterium halimionae]NII95523.1 thiosulfate dehydrogenase [quinone] large subunit [Microbacterium halimionae]
MSTTAAPRVTTTAATSNAAATKAIPAENDVVTTVIARRVLAVSRYAIGFIFLWAFLDKTFGLGFSTPVERAWVNGGTPAQGFLNSEAVTGPLQPFFQGIASPLVDVLFMAGMLGVGLAVMIGIGLRISAVAGTAIMIMMYLAEWPFAILTGSTNPIVDYHIIYALMLVFVAAASAGDTWGLGAQWKKLPIVQKNHWLV